MSSHASPSSHAPAAGSHDHGESKFHLFVQVAMILAVITGVDGLTTTMEAAPDMAEAPSMDAPAPP